MIAHNSMNLNAADKDNESAAEDNFWGLNSVIEEYHRNHRRGTVRGGSHVALGTKMQTVNNEVGRPTRQAAHRLGS